MSHFRTIDQKIIAPEDLVDRVALLKKEKKTIATLNGSFDLLHAGHLAILKEAALQAHVLIVALNSDTSIQQYKSPHRPIIPLNYRLELIGALEMVGFVTWFDELDPRELIQKIRPDVHVNGAEYGSDCIEATMVKAIGARLHLVKLVPGLSTSEIIRKIRCAP